MPMASEANTYISKPQIISMQTVTSIKPTERQSCLISIENDQGMEIFRRRVHIVLYYRKVSEEESGWLVAGWMRESLATALVEQPMFGGRLRRVENGGRDLEIVSNDCGVRLFEAQIKIKLSEFLDLKDKGEEEAQLVFWEDIDEQNPLFSPLCYIQVTNFECGGYSIGFSCSLLVADPLAITSFLKKWVSIHKTLTSKANISRPPLFYFPNLKNPSASVSNINCSISSINKGKTEIFEVPSAENLNLDYESKRAIAAICIEEAEQRFGGKMTAKVSFIIKEPSEEIKVGTFSREGPNTKGLSRFNGLNCVSWGDLETDELSLYKGNKPASVSHWMYAIADEALVMLCPSTEEGKSGMNIVVTIPNEKMT